MHNRFTEEYGLIHPVVQGSLGVVSMPALVAAVSRAGGMGTLGAVGWPVMGSSDLRSLIQAVRSLTDRPFGVSFDASLATADHIRVCIEEAVDVVSFDRPDAASHFVRVLKRNGVRVWARATSVAEARCAVRGGADAVIAHGRGGAGNVGQTGTFALVPSVADAIWPVPVLASGGIADGRGLAAALALGADAGWIGTRFLASREANAHEDYKRRVVQAGEGDTAVSRVFAATRRTSAVRTLRNRVVRESIEPSVGTQNDSARLSRSLNGLDRLIGRTELGGRAIEIPEFSCMLPTPETEGDLEEMCMPAGENVALIRSVRPAAEIVKSMAAEMQRSLARAAHGQVTA